MRRSSDSAAGNRAARERAPQRPAAAAWALVAIAALSFSIGLWNGGTSALSAVTLWLCAAGFALVGRLRLRLIRRTSATLAFGAFLAGAYTFALDERVHISVEVGSGGIEVWVDGQPATLAWGGPSPFPVRLAIAARRFGPAEEKKPWRQAIASIYHALSRVDLPAEIRGAFVQNLGSPPRGAETLQPRQPDWTRRGDRWIFGASGILMSEEAISPGGRIEFDLVRHVAPVAVLVIPAGASGELLEVRYDSRARGVSFWRSSDGGRDQSLLRSTMVDPTISQGARRLVRLVVVNLAFGLLFWLLCSALGRATRAQATLLPSPRIRWSRLLERAAVAATACAMAAGLLLVADQLLDRMPHVQDSVCYLFQANVFVSGRLHAVLPADPDAFAHEFLAPHAGLWTSVFPPGQSLLLALGVVLGIPWAVGPLASALAVLPVFFAVRSLFDARTAALTIALFATSPAVLSLGATMMSHAACLFACSLAFYFAVTLSERVGRDAPARTISFCLGAALGFAALTRPLTAAAWSVPVAFWILIAFARARRNPIPAIVLAVAGGAPFLGFFAIHNHSFSGDVWTTPLDVYLRLFGQDFFELISRRHAFELAWSFRNTLTNLHAFLSMQIGLPIILTGGFAAIPFLSGRAKFADALLAAAALSLPVAYFFYWADGAMYGARYWFEMTPAFLALSARGILLSLDAAGGGARRLIPLLFLAVCASGHLAGVGVGVLSGLRGYNSMSRAASDSVTNRIEKPALVFVDSEPRHEWWLYGRLFWQNAPTLDGPVVYARLRGDERDRVLAERYSGRTFYLLRQDLSLTPWVPGVRPTRPPGRAPGSSFPPPTPVPTGPRPPEAT